MKENSLAYPIFALSFKKALIGDMNSKEERLN